MTPKKIIFSVTLTLNLFHNSANAQFNSIIDISELNGVNGFVINGPKSIASFGNSVSSAGDINGDGIDDLVIGADAEDPINMHYTGSSHVVFGSNVPLPNPFNIDTLNGTNGFTIIGQAEGDKFGSSVSSAGDVNGDGIDDLIIGASTRDPDDSESAGSSYVIFGSNTGFPNPFNLNSLNGTNGFIINGGSGGIRSGKSVSSAGDVNGDGIDDLIIGAYRASPNTIANAGSSFVVFGSKSLFPNPFNLASLNGTNGFTINGVAPFDWSGLSVSSAGDVNDDGIDDLIIGARSAEPAGSSYVIFGSDSGFSNPLNLANLSGLIGFTINGAAESDGSGSSVSSAGDVNGDGINDLIIGAQYADPDNNNNAGSSYVIFGSDRVFSNPFNLASVNGQNGFIINGVSANDKSGSSVSSAGDVNGDGIDDLIIGEHFPNFSGLTGSNYVVFGSNSPFPNPLNLATLNGLNGFTINGVAAIDWSNSSVSSAGDINNDGIDDLIIGDSSHFLNIAGSSYVVFGNDVIFNNDFGL